MSALYLNPERSKPKLSKTLDAFGHQPPTTLVLNNYFKILTKFDFEGGD